MSERQKLSVVRLVVGLLLSLHLGVCLAGPRRPQPLAVIPLKLVHGLPTATVLIDGSPLRLYFDLGAFQAISLTPAELNRVTVSYSKERTAIRNGQGETLESRKFVAHHVSVSGFDLGDLQGAEAIFGGMVPPDQNGRVGLSAIGRYLFVLDYPAKEIRLYPSGDEAALVAECGHHSFRVDVKDGIATSTMRTEFGERKVIWDTGAADNFIRPSAVPSRLLRGRTIDAPPFHDSTSSFVRLQNLSIDSSPVGAQVFRLWDFKAPEVDAYLGTSLFSTRRVCLDMRTGRGAMRSPRSH